MYRENSFKEFQFLQKNKGKTKLISFSNIDKEIQTLEYILCLKNLGTKKTNQIKSRKRFF